MCPSSSFSNYCNHSCCIHCGVHHLLKIMNESMEENQKKQTQSKETPNPRKKKPPTRDRQPPCIQIQRTSNLSISLSLSLSLSPRVFLNCCCSNTAPEFTLVAGCKSIIHLGSTTPPKNRNCPKKKKKKWKQISTHI